MQTKNETAAETPGETVPDDTKTSETEKEAESEPAAETTDEKDGEMLVFTPALESSKYAPIRNTPPKTKGLAYPYVKSFTNKADFQKYAEYVTENFEADTPNLEWQNMGTAHLHGTFSDKAADYNTAYFKDYALLLAVIEAPYAMGYYPEVGELEYKNGEINVTVTSDPFDGIKTTVFHIFISVPQSQYTNKIKLNYNQRTEPQNGVAVSVPFEYKIGGQIKPDREYIGYVPQYSHTAKAFYTYEEFDKYISERKMFSAYVKNEYLGTAFGEGAQEYDREFFEKNILLVFGDDYLFDTVPTVLSVNADGNKIRIGHDAAIVDDTEFNRKYKYKYAYLYYGFIEISKEYISGTSYRVNTGIDKSVIISSPLLNDMEEKTIPAEKYSYTVTPIKDGEKFSTGGNSAYAVTSKEQLSELTALRTFNGDITTSAYSKSFVETASKYTDEFFKTKFLLMLRVKKLPEGDSVINTVTYDELNIYVTLNDYNRESNGNTDESYYVFLELPAEYYSYKYRYAVKN